jgi:hypothetical protein
MPSKRNAIASRIAAFASSSEFPTATTELGQRRDRWWKPLKSSHHTMTALMFGRARNFRCP